MDAEGIPVGEVPKSYQHGKRYDLKEYDEWRKRCNGAQEENIDIISIGYWWDDNGVEKYDPGVASWRKLVEEKVMGHGQLVLNEGTVEVLGLSK